MAKNTKTPLRIAAIDIGSNAIRCLAVVLEKDTAYSPLYSERCKVRLGHGVFLSGKLDREMMELAISHLNAMKQNLDKLQLDKIRCVATSAVRQAANAKEFLDKVYKSTGLTIEIITGSEEARLVYVAVKNLIDLSNLKWILVDLGGGSLQISIIDAHGILWSESHAMGSVRLLEVLTQSQEIGVNLLKEYIATISTPPFLQLKEKIGFIATGGNIEKIAELALCTKDTKGISILPLEQLKTIGEKMASLSYHQRIEQFGLKEDRADVILPAALVFSHLCNATNTKKIILPHVGVKEGIVYDVAQQLLVKSSYKTHQEQQVLTSATTLGKKYSFDEKHALQVAKLSLLLFDQFSDLHLMQSKERMLLSAAALLHDIGVYVSFKKHHKHSMYLIMNSEIPGFSSDEMLLIALIARYHRKSFPQQDHEYFNTVSTSYAQIITKCAALLRVADALDREHLQKVHTISCTIDQQECIIAIQGEGGEYGLERWALQNKENLFFNTFKKHIRLIF